MNRIPVVLIAAFLACCGISAGQEAPAPTTTPKQPPTSMALTPSNEVAMARGDALCELIVGHFSSFLPGDPAKKASADGDTCAMGGAPPGQARQGLVRVNVGSHGGTTPEVLRQLYSGDHEARSVADLATDGAYETVINDQITHKIGYGLAKNGHFIVIEVEFAGGFGGAEQARSHDAAKAFISAL